MERPTLTGQIHFKKYTTTKTTLKTCKLLFLREASGETRSHWQSLSCRKREQFRCSISSKQESYSCQGKKTYPKYSWYFFDKTSMCYFSDALQQVVEEHGGCLHSARQEQRLKSRSIALLKSQTNCTFLKHDFCFWNKAHCKQKTDPNYKIILQCFVGLWLNIF